MMEERQVPATIRQTFVGKLDFVVLVLSVTLAVFHLYTAQAGPFYTIMQRSIHVGLSVILLLCIIDHKQGVFVRIVNAVFIFTTLVITVYVCMARIRIIRDVGYAHPTNTDILLGYMMIIMLVEVSRRVIGWEFAALIIIALMYGLLGAWLPGPLAHPGFSLNYLIVTSFINPLGIYGSITAVSATTIASYVLFGAFLIATGGGNAFLKLALLVAGRARGGAAQVAVVSSSLMGMINGSSVANVATVGVITIPMMKQQGYDSEFAGAVESAASSGGQILPPIMGAGAFVMAEVVGVPYLQIAKMAIIPAILYYLTIALTVYFEARKKNLQPMAKSAIPQLRDVRRDGLMLGIPVIVLLYFLGERYTPYYAAFWATATCIILYTFCRLIFDRDGSLAQRAESTFATFLYSCREGARILAFIGVLVAASEIMVAVIGITGIGLKMSQVIFYISSGNLFLAFLCAAVIALILGTGLPTIPSYIITAAVVAPALLKLGVPLIVTHFFCFFFAVMSGLTPPVAATAFVAAGIAGGGVWKTSLEACRLALAGFLVPFVFAFHMGVLGVGSVLEIVMASIFGALGLAMFAAAFAQHWIRPLRAWQQLILVLCGVLILAPNLVVQIAGCAAATICLAFKAQIRSEPSGMS